MAIEPGQLLGGRFEILGVVGRGGSGTVYLAQDQLRNERVALKVVHDHLTADAGVRKRLHREVQSATVLRSDTALVPHDLHELDDRLALSMPFHPGQTLEQRVQAEGALPVAEVRQIARRVSTALAEAHRAGVLHRDVTAGNILLTEGGTDTVLTDFGLARLRHGTGARSTALLGTAGYAAPEVYGGQRSDPRSDLYGLGAALYLALTGQPAFNARDPMAALRQQLEDGWTPLRELRPDVPDDLADLVEALLQGDPDARPAGAREVLDLLEARTSPQTLPTSAAPDPVQRQYLPPGEYTVVVKEKDGDKSRRSRLRAKRKQARATWGAGFEEAIHTGAMQILQALGIQQPEGQSAEEMLANAVAERAHLPADSLVLPNALFVENFRLVDRTDEETAEQLAEEARTQGFSADAVEMGQPRTPWDWLAAHFWVPIAVGWSTFPFAVGIADNIGIRDTAMVIIPTMIALSIVLPVWASSRKKLDPKAQRYPVAFRAGLQNGLTDGEHPPPRYAVGLVSSTDDPEAPSPPAEPSSRGASLMQRVRAALDALHETIHDPAVGLPEPAQQDLRSTAKDLSRSAEELAREVDRLQAALGTAGAPEEEVALLQGRLDRLQTLARAGEPVDEQAVRRLQQTLREHEADLAAEAQVEARLASTTAQLLEIASTASKVRRQLLTQADGTASDGVDRLRAQVEATDVARQESALPRSESTDARISARESARAAQSQRQRDG